MRLFVYSMRTFDELPFFEKFCAKYNVEYDYTTETPCLENLDMAAGYDVVDVITTVFDKPMLKKLHDLGIKCIATRTIGCDHIDVEYAKELGLGVIHISYSPNSVADYTIMMMLMGCRKMKHIMERAAIQDYTLKGKLGRELPDCTVGIIGTGRIGAAMCRICNGFGMKVIAYDVYENPDLKDFVTYVTLDELLAQSDLISLHCPLMDSTYHLIQLDTIKKMKDGVILVNTSRGALVKTEDLIEGIRLHKFAGVGLDVYEEETKNVFEDRSDEILEHSTTARLLSFPNVMITSHQGFFTKEALEAIAETTLQNALDFESGKKSPNQVQ